MSVPRLAVDLPGQGQVQQLMTFVLDLSAELARVKQEARDEIEKGLRKGLDSRLATIESLMRRVVAIQEVLIERGVLTREEIDRKRAEISPFWGE